jgi:subtilisin family serine protease
MRKIACLSVVLLSLYACKKNVQTAESPAPKEALSKTVIDAAIKAEVTQRGVFNWSSASDVMVWSALQQSDQIMSIGFKPEGEGDISHKIHEIDITKGDWAAARAAILALVFEEERKSNPALKMEEMEVYKETVLPLVDVKVTSFSTVQKLRASRMVRYAEPMGYEPDWFLNAPNPGGRAVLGSSGCGSNTAEAGLVAGVDYTNITPGAKASWNHSYHGVANAWTKSTGSGTKVMIIDSGVSSDQSLFGSNFNSGASAGRTIEKISTLPSWGLFGLYGSLEGPADGCGHGTAMAGACAAPRSPFGSAAGIAYNANLVSVRASSDVFIDESRENKGVSDAYVLAGNRADVKIISMSMGRITSSGQMSDAILYAYNRGKLIFCAAGTSFSWTAGLVGVIFPATMSQVNAVTGVQDNLTTRCNACHEGSQVDFVVVMEKAANERHPLSADMNSFAPSTVGGSSVATASTAGMAALVWARFPSLTRDQVLNKLIVSSSNYPTRSSKFGWGRINADAATN